MLCAPSPTSMLTDLLAASILVMRPCSKRTRGDRERIAATTLPGSTSPPTTSVSMGVKSEKLFRSTSVISHRRSRGSSRINSCATLMPAKPPPRMRIRGYDAVAMLCHLRELEDAESAPLDDDGDAAIELGAGERGVAVDPLAQQAVVNPHPIRSLEVALDT